MWQLYPTSFSFLLLTETFSFSLRSSTHPWLFTLKGWPSCLDWNEMDWLNSLRLYYTKVHLYQFWLLLFLSKKKMIFLPHSLLRLCIIIDSFFLEDFSIFSVLIPSAQMWAIIGFYSTKLHIINFNNTKLPLPAFVHKLAFLWLIFKLLKKINYQGVHHNPLFSPQSTEVRIDLFLFKCLSVLGNVTSGT